MDTGIANCAKQSLSLIEWYSCDSIYRIRFERMVVFEPTALRIVRKETVRIKARRAPTDLSHGHPFV